MTPRDVEYYSERIREERARAREAGRADVAAVHEELARLYEVLIGSNDSAPVLRLVSSSQRAA